MRFLGKKISPASVTVISQTNEEDDYVIREAVYEERRQELQYQFRHDHKCCFLVIHFKHFRNSSKNIQQVCRSFFAHPGHFTNQFIFVTRSIDSAEPLRKNFAAQIGKESLHIKKHTFPVFHKENRELKILTSLIF